MGCHNAPPAIAIGVAVTLVLGLAPQYFLDLADKAGVFVR